MKIAFLLGSPDISGGSYVIFQHALYLLSKGADVTLITENKFARETLAWHPEAFNKLRLTTIEEVTLEKFDLAIATWWRTVYNLYQIDAKRYSYFVQSIESKFYPEAEKAARLWADATYTFELATITEVTWIKDYLKENYGRIAYLVHNGIRKDIYNRNVVPIVNKSRDKFRILIEGPLNIFFKNVERTIELCASSDVDEIWLMTSTPDIKKFPGCDRVFSKVPITEAAKVYASCDCLVKLSYVEGMFGPPLEIFHTGGTAVVYDVTGANEYIKNNQNGIIVKKDDEEGVISSLSKLKNDSRFLEGLQKSALETAENWPDWENSSDKFFQAILDMIENYKHTESRMSLRNKSLNLGKWYEFETR